MTAVQDIEAGTFPDLTDDIAWGEVAPLTEQHCWDLLVHNDAARLAVNAEGGPLVFPVRYHCDGSAVILRSWLTSEIDATAMNDVTLIIDGVSPDEQSGWSVLARGHAWDITNSLDESSERQRTLVLPVRVPGPNDHWLRVHIKEVRGRRFGHWMLRTSK